MPYAILLNLNLFLQAPQIDYSQASPFGRWAHLAFNFVTMGNPYLLSVLFIVLVLAQAFMFNQLTSRHDFLSNVGYMPAFCYVLVVSLFNTHLYLAPSFLSGFFILGVLQQVFKSYNNESFVPLFDIGFFTGMAALTYLPASLLIIFMVIALLITRIFYWREWVVCFMGLFVPYFLTFTLFFVIDRLPDFLQTHFILPVYANAFLMFSYAEQITKTILVMTLSLLAGFLFQINFLKTTIRKRKQLALFVYLFLLSLPTFLMTSRLCFEPVGLQLIPISIFVAYIFSKKERNILSSLIHISIIAVTLIFQYFV